MSPAFIISTTLLRRWRTRHYSAFNAVTGATTPLRAFRHLARLAWRATELLLLPAVRYLPFARTSAAASDTFKHLLYYHLPAASRLLTHLPNAST